MASKQAVTGVHLKQDVHVLSFAEVVRAQAETSPIRNVVSWQHSLAASDEKGCALVWADFDAPGHANSGSGPQEHLRRSESCS